MNKSNNKENSVDSEKERLRATVGESFNIYQASLAMIAIFIGFVFSALLEFLTGSSEMVGLMLWAVRFLVGAMITLSLSLVCLHGTAHKVVRYWRIFFPVSRFLRVGFSAFSLGLVFMFLTVSMLLFNKKMIIEAWAVIISALTVVGLFLYFRRIHQAASYMINVD